MRALGIIGRYIAGRFLLCVGCVFGLCLVLIFMIDFFELLRDSGKHGNVPVPTIVLITLLRLLAYAELTLPFAMLTGSIGAFLLLSRSSELVVIRASGMSVWQFLLPGVAVALALGLGFNYGYNPLAAAAIDRADMLYAQAFGKEQNLLKTKNAGQWLRQDGADGASIISAAAASNKGMSLTGVGMIQYDHKEQFVERVDAASAELRDGYWEMHDAWVTAVGDKPTFHKDYLVSTHLTPAQVSDALGSVLSMSYLDLPRAIELSERAGLPAVRYKVQYANLQSRPLLLAVTVLLAATVSLRTFRFGGIQTKVVVGLCAGFGFFVFAEVSRQMGIAGLTAPAVAAWVPPIVGGLLSLTVLMHQEDG